MSFSVWGDVWEFGPDCRLATASKEAGGNERSKQKQWLRNSEEEPTPGKSGVFLVY